MEILHVDAGRVTEKLEGCGRFILLMNVSRAASRFILFFLVTIFVLAGNQAMAQSGEQSSKPGETSSANAENGKKLFAKYGCYECHGREAQGGGLNGPRLAPDPLPLSVLRIYIRRPRGEMPPYTEKVVSDKDLTEIYAFLASQPQPPPVKTVPLLNH